MRRITLSRFKVPHSKHEGHDEHQDVLSDFNHFFLSDSDAAITPAKMARMKMVTNPSRIISLSE